MKKNKDKTEPMVPNINGDLNDPNDPAFLGHTPFQGAEMPVTPETEVNGIIGITIGSDAMLAVKDWARVNENERSEINLEVLTNLSTAVKPRDSSPNLRIQCDKEQSGRGWFQSCVGEPKPSRSRYSKAIPDKRKSCLESRDPTSLFLLSARY
jgi:hypothetical protein